MRTRLFTSISGAILLAACANPESPDPFDRISVNVRGAGTGSGVIGSQSSVVNIGCRVTATTKVDVDGRCQSSFPDAGAGGQFSLTAYPDEGSVFDHWDGCNSVNGPVCELSFSQGVGQKTFAITAHFRSTVAGNVVYDSNLLLNPGFEANVLVASLPSQTGRWQGDSAESVSGGSVPVHGGTRVLQFLSTGARGASSEGLASQQWQLVDVSALAGAIDSAKVVADAQAWFYRVAGVEGTDDMFQLRIGAFRGVPSEFPASFVAPNPVRLVEATFILNAPASVWTRAQRTFTLPAGTRYISVEINAYENFSNNASFPEFIGHYADDISLVLRRLP